jgi:hypothetical protein
MMLIGFSICDGRHVVADEKSTLLYRKMHIVVCAFYRSSLRQRRCRSVVFVVIIVDECEKENGESGK